MDHPASNRCPECGAIYKDGKTCRQQFETMLAYEFENPETFGAAHHLTVACYNLQHPSGFTGPALEWLRTSLAAAVNEGQSPREWRARAQEQFNGNAKVKVVRKSPAPVVRKEWSMTATDIPLDNPADYIAGIHDWARSILADLRV